MKCAFVLPAMMMVSALSMSQALADDLTTQPQQGTQNVDKGKYNLFNPTPANLLRGMDTDRPNITNTPHTIDAGHVQLEAGLIDYSYYHHHAAGGAVDENDFGLGQFNFRLGVLNNLELNAVINAYETDRSHDAAGTSTAGSFGDTTLGAKLNLWGIEGGDDAWTTALAIQPQFKIPTAQSEVGNGHFEFSVAVPFLVNLPAGFHLSVQPGVSFERNTANTGDVAGFENAISIDRDVLGKLDVYVEYASDVTTERHAKTTETINVGAVYPLTDNIVLDAGINFGLNDQTNNIEFLSGISVRF